MSRNPSEIKAYGGSHNDPATIDAGTPLATATVTTVGSETNFDFVGGIDISNEDYITVYTKAIDGGVTYFGASQIIPCYDIPSKILDESLVLQHVNGSVVDQDFGAFTAASNLMTNRTFAVNMHIHLDNHPDDSLNDSLDGTGFSRVRLTMVCDDGTGTVEYDYLNAYVYNLDVQIASGQLTEASFPYIWALKGGHMPIPSWPASGLLIYGTDNHPIEIDTDLVGSGSNKIIDITYAIADGNSVYGPERPLGSVLVNLGAPGSCNFVGLNATGTYGNSTMTLNGTVDTTT